MIHVFVCFCSADTEDVCIVERLFSSSLVAIVSLKAPRKLKVCHFKKGTEICNYSYSNTILAVKLNRQVSHFVSMRRLSLSQDCCIVLFVWSVKNLYKYMLKSYNMDVFPQRLIVCLEESLYIHNIRDMKVLHTIRETPPNPSGGSHSCHLCISIYCLF